jgi:hypothetical protein
MRIDCLSTEEVTMGWTTQQQIKQSINEELADANKRKSIMARRRETHFIPLAGRHMKETCQCAAQDLRLNVECGI